MTKRWVIRLLAGVFTVLVVSLGPLGGTAHADCKPDSVPDEAGSGLPGVIDNPTKNPSGTTKYGEYGWSGLEWHTCDLGTGPDVTADPVAIVDTLFGNYGMGLATALSATMTQTHSWAADPGGLLQPVDSTVEGVTEVTREALWDQWAGAIIIIAGIIVVLQANRGETRRALKTGAAIVVACGAVAWIAAGPVNAARAFDGVAANVVGGVDKSISSTTGDTDLSNDEARGTTFHDQILYKLWCRGALGDEKAGKRFCADLYKAQAVKYSDVGDYDADERRDQYNDVADDIKDANDSYYTTLKGKSYNRTAQGGLAVVLMGTIALIRIPAEVLMVAGLLVMRLAVMFGPIFALAALVEGGRPIAFAGMKMVLASFVNVAVFGVIAAVHTGIVGAIVQNSGVFATLFLVAVLTFVIWHISKPFRSPTRLASGQQAGDQIAGTGDAPANAVSRLGGMMGPLLAAYAGTKAVSQLDDDDGEGSGSSPRREDVGASDEGFSRVSEETRPAPAALPAGISDRQTGSAAAVAADRAPDPDPEPTPAPAARAGGADADEGSSRGISEVHLRSDSTVHVDGPAMPIDGDGLFRPDAMPTVTPKVPDDIRLIEPEYDSSGGITYEMFRPDRPSPEMSASGADQR